MALTDTSTSRLAFLRIANEKDAMPTNPTLYELPFTSESLSEKLTSAQSASIRADRQFAGSRLVRGESSGDVGLEVAYGLWFDELLSGVMQATPFPASPLANASDTMSNDKTKTFFIFEKRLEAESGNTYTVFQGCQINTLSFDVQSNSLANMSIGVVGLQAVDAPNDTGHTYTAYNIDKQIDTNSVNLEFKTLADVVIPVTAQSFSLALDNQMRGQQAVGSFYNAGNASGRFKATMSASIYFRNNTLFNNFKNNTGIKVIVTLNDDAGNYYKFAMNNVKVTSYDISAGGADQDLVASVELQAFPDTATPYKTLTITRFTA